LYRKKLKEKNKERGETRKDEKPGANRKRQGQIVIQRKEKREKERQGQGKKMARGKKKRENSHKGEQKKLKIYAGSEGAG